MQNWKGWMAGAVVVAIVVAFFIKYSSDRLDQFPPDFKDQGDSEARQFAHLIGQPAPDFEGDFAVNGEPVKLSQLKGKVVLLDFWAVWCGYCIDAFPHMRDLHDAYYKDGLRIVGVTMYNYESGRFIGFDSARGKITSLPTANKTSEQAMLKSFVQYHGLPYLVMPVPGASMNKVTRDYGIQGYPQIFVIDRKGIVRMVRVGGGPDNAMAIENQIKKLLAEAS